MQAPEHLPALRRSSTTPAISPVRPYFLKLVLSGTARQPSALALLDALSSTDPVLIFPPYRVLRPLFLFL